MSSRLKEGDVTHYAVLGLEFGASDEAIKESYRKLLLQYHPDKATCTRVDETERVLCHQDKFLKIQEAWKILSDPVAKDTYDKGLEERRLTQASPVWCTINRAEMDYDQESDEYWYSCRCGGEYSLKVKDDVTSQLVVCDTCSLALRVLITCGH